MTFKNTNMNQIIVMTQKIQESKDLGKMFKKEKIMKTNKRIKTYLKGIQQLI